MTASLISPSIAMLINKSIKTGTFPFQLKQAKVHPIFKGGTKSDPSNYRPISILPTVSNHLKKHINKHLMGYLNKHKLLHESQSGFRHKHSCQSALIKLIDSWAECIDRGDLVGALFLDFRKAFDKGFTDFLNILSGVPQGSILSPTVFLLFINDLPLCFEHCSSDLYADDTTVHTRDSSVNNIEHNIMYDLKNAIEWSKPNKMQLHYGKTTCHMHACWN